jgi:hypothetical protein
MRQTWRWFGPVDRVSVADQPLHQVAVPVDLAVEVGVLGLVGAARDDRDDPLGERPATPSWRGQRRVRYAAAAA